MTTRYYTSILAVCLPFVFVLLAVTSCKKFIDIDLAKNLVDANLIFEDDVTADAAVTAIYYDLRNSGIIEGASTRFTSSTGLCADELFEILPSNPGSLFQNNMLEALTDGVKNTWEGFYKTIYQSNAVIEGAAKSAGLTEAGKNRVEGEALFMRAFSHFYLVNIYGKVPLITATDYKQNSLVARDEIETVYEQIIKDLIAAQSKLSDNYVSSEKVRPNKSTVNALLARVYLYNGNPEKALETSTLVIDNPVYQLQSNLDDVFLTNSQEAIWQLGATIPNRNTSEGENFVSNDILRRLYLRQELVFSFEPGDNRRAKWIATYASDAGNLYYPFKYKISSQNEPITEYLMFFRLAEQYLIRAESKIKTDDIEGGIADLNYLRSFRRAAATVAVPNPLPDLSLSLTKEQAVLAVENERKYELFTEWGHRWLDLKRTNRATPILGAIKADNWQSTDELFPIPQEEINKNPNLKPQNPGYN